MGRKSRAFSVATAAILMLSGCTIVDPIELTMVNGNLALHFCSSRELAHLEINQLPPGGSYPDDAHLIATVDDGISPADGSTVQFGDGVFDHFAADEVDPLPGTLYEVVYETIDGVLYTPVYVIPSSGMRDGLWLRSDGSARDAPCGS